MGHVCAKILEVFMQRIPLDNSPNQNFDVTLNINGKNITYNLLLSWNETANYWTMQVRDTLKNPITDSIPLLSGQNLLQGLEYLKIGEAYLIRNSNVDDEIPDIDTIGTNFILLWGDNQ